MIREKGSIVPHLVALLAGVLIGLGVFTFGYAQGSSYLTDDPGACVNCHVMREQFDAWLKGSHRAAAVCNDCHAPGPPIGKYFTKAVNGFNHSLAFTTGRFPDEILITRRNRQVTNQACLKCHADVTDGIRATRHRNDELSCVGCHRDTGHAH